MDNFERFSSQDEVRSTRLHAKILALLHLSYAALLPTKIEIPARINRGKVPNTVSSLPSPFLVRCYNFSFDLEISPCSCELKFHLVQMMFFNAARAVGSSFSY